MKRANCILSGALAAVLSVVLSAGPVFAKSTAGSSAAADTTAAETVTTAAAAETTAAETGTASGESEESSSGEKVFRFATNTEPTTLDPTKTISVGDDEIQKALTEGLVRTIDGEATPGCAESWDISDDQKTYTFHLREGLKWSDGEDLTAGDFVYALQRLVDPETAASYSWIAETAGIVNAKECYSGEKEVSELGVTAPDDQTVVIELAHPTTYFLPLIGNWPQFSPVRQDVVEKYGQDFAAAGEENVYSGPFVLDSYKDQILVFKKNPNYWNAEAVHFDRVEESIVTDANTQLAMYEAGDLDWVNIPVAQVSNYLDSDEHGSFMNGNDDFCYINCSSESQPILQNTNFRRALNYAIDRNSYITLTTDDVNTPAATYVFPEVSGAKGGTYGEEYGDVLHAWPLDGDADKAKECLQKALDETGIEDPSTITLSFTCTDAESEKTIAEVLQQMWQNTLGINIEIRQVTYAEKYSTIFPQHDFDIGYGGWSCSYSDPYTYLQLFQGDNANNSADYQNPEYDEKLATTVDETDPVKRMDTLAECENILLDDAAVIPLQYRTQHYLLNKKFSGIHFSVGAVNLDWSFGDVSGE